MDYTTLQAVKRQLGNVAGSADDATLSDLVTAYSAEIDNLLNQTFGQMTITAKDHRAIVDQFGRMTVYPECPLVISITAAAWNDGTTLTYAAITPTQLRVQNRPDGAIVRWIGTDMGGYRDGRDMSIQLSYVGGYTSVAALPPDIEISCRQLVAWAYQLRSAPISTTGTPETGMIRPPRDWPNYVTTALKSYRRYYTL